MFPKYRVSRHRTLVSKKRVAVGANENLGPPLLSSLSRGFAMPLAGKILSKYDMLAILVPVPLSKIQMFLEDRAVRLLETDIRRDKSKSWITLDAGG